MNRGPGPLIVLCTVQLMVLLDGTIVNIALPSMAASLDASAGGVQWVVTSYYLVFGGLLLLGGRIGDLFGRRRTFVAGLSLFTAASLAGGFAPGLAVLIGARVAQGVGAALAAPSVLALLTLAYPGARERARALAVYAAMSGVGAAAGLVAGGLLTEWASWRWVLFVNVPIGLVVLALSRRTLGETPRGSGRFDVAGALAVSGGLALLVVGLDRAPAEGWGDPVVLGCLLASAVGLGAFVLVERSSGSPLLPLRLLADPARAAGLSLVGLLTALMFVLFYFGSQYAQGVQHASPVVAGLEYVPFSVVLLVTSQFVARLAVKVAPTRLVPAGSLLAAAGMAWLSRLSADSSYLEAVLGPLLVCAVGVGLAMVPLTLTVMARVAPADTGVVSGLLNAARLIGSALGVSAGITVASSVHTGPVDGYRAAFAATAGVLAVAAVLGLVRTRSTVTAPAQPEPVAS